MAPHYDEDSAYSFVTEGLESDTLWAIVEILPDETPRFMIALFTGPKEMALEIAEMLSVSSVNEYVAFPVRYE